MEHCDVLDLSNNTDVFALQYICLPRVNHHLDTWRCGWENHTISGTGKSPKQMWVHGMQMIANSSHPSTVELFYEDVSLVTYNFNI